MTRWIASSVDDLQLRPQVFADRLERRAKLRDVIDAGMPAIDKAVAAYKLDEYYQQALSLIVSGRAGGICAGSRAGQDPRPIRSQYLRAKLPLARRLVEAGTRVVEVIWPKVANSDNHSWDHHVDLTARMKTSPDRCLMRGFRPDRGFGRARSVERNAGDRRG